MARDWHALTAIEIAVAQPRSWHPDDLAALTARLCHQAASWDDRTLLPVPLHLARASDQDHPGHPSDIRVVVLTGGTVRRRARQAVSRPRKTPPSPKAGQRVTPAIKDR
jgi:RNaseH domain of pPIWI_RE